MVRLRRVFILGLMLILSQAIQAQDASLVTTDIQLSDQMSLISVSPVPDDANRVMYVWHDHAWQTLSYPDGFEGAQVIPTYSETYDYQYADGQTLRITLLKSGSYLIDSKSTDEIPSSTWLLDPQAMTLTRFYSRCLDGVTPTNEVNGSTDENYWPIIYTDTTAYFCNPVTGEHSGPLPRSLIWTNAWLSSDGRFLSFSREQKDKRSFEGVIWYSYSYELATQTLRFLGDNAMPWNMYRFEYFGALTPTAFASAGAEMPEWSIWYAVATDYSRANSEQIVMTSTRFPPRAISDPPGLEFMPTAMGDGYESGPCALVVFNALTWETTAHTTGTLCDDGFVIPDGSGDRVYWALYPSSGIVRYNALTGVRKTLYVGDIEGLGSVSPHGRYARVDLDYTGFADYDPDDMYYYGELERGSYIMRLTDGAIMGIAPSDAEWVSDSHMLYERFLYTISETGVETNAFPYKQILLLPKTGHIVAQADDGTYGLYEVGEERFTPWFHVANDELSIEITQTEQQTFLITFSLPVPPEGADGREGFLRQVWTVSLKPQ